MFLYDKTNILEGLGIFEVDFAHGHEPANVPRVRANAYHMLTTPPRVFRDPKMCLRNIWTAPYCLCSNVKRNATQWTWTLMFTTGHHHILSTDPAAPQ